MTSPLDIGREQRTLAQAPQNRAAVRSAHTSEAGLATSVKVSARTPSKARVERSLRYEHRRGLQILRGHRPHSQADRSPRQTRWALSVLRSPDVLDDRHG